MDLFSTSTPPRPRVRYKINLEVCLHMAVADLYTHSHQQCVGVYFTPLISKNPLGLANDGCLHVGADIIYTCGGPVYV